MNRQKGGLFLTTQKQNHLMSSFCKKHSTIKTQKLWQLEWGGNVLFLNGTNNSKGLAMLQTYYIDPK